MMDPTNRPTGTAAEGSELSRLATIALMGEDAVVVFGPDERIRFANEQAEILTGRRNEDLVGSDFRELLVDRHLVLMDQMRQVLGEEQGKRICTEVEVLTSDGTRRDCQLCIGLTPGEGGQVETYAYLRDITPLKQLQRQLQSERDWLLTILDSLADGIYIVSPDRKVEFMNRALMEEFGDGRGATCYEFFERRGAPCPECRQLDVMAGRTVRYRRTFKSKVKNYEAVVSPLRRTDGTTLLLGIFRDVTARDKAEERARSAERRYRELFENVQQGVFVSTADGRFEDCNPALLTMLGYDSKDEFLQMDIARDLYVRPQDREAFQALMETEGSVSDLEAEFRRKDGSVVTVLLAAHARRDARGRIVGYQGLNVDITQRKAIERQLREKSEFLAKVIESSVEGIIAADMQGRVLLYNKAAERILGYEVEEALEGIGVEQFYPPGMARQIMTMLRSEEHGGVGKLESIQVEHTRKDGTPVFCDLSAAIIYDGDGSELATVGVFADRTERITMEKRLAETRQRLMASEQMAAMGRLTSQLAHEINNPLFGIINTLELLRPAVTPKSRRHRLLEMAISEGRRLGDLIRKMLTLYRPEEEKRQLTSLSGLLEDLLLFVDKQMRERGIAVGSDLPDDLPPVYISSNQFKQVFLNLLHNARDAMPAGGTVKVSAEQRQGNIEVKVKDTGIGIPEAHLPRVFHAFFTTKGKARGVGLGLAVCYGIVKDHLGEIDVKSTVGQGTMVTVRLPASRQKRRTTKPPREIGNSSD